MSERESGLLQFRRTSWFLLAFAFCFLGIVVFFRSLLAAVIVAVLFAYILEPLVDRLDRRLKWPRPLIVVAVIAVVILIFSTLIAGLVPLLYHQIMAIAARLPAAKEYVLEAWLPIIQDLLARFGVPQAAVLDSLKSSFSFSATVGDPLHTLQGLMSQTSVFFDVLVNILFIPFICFFLLNDYKAIRNFLRSLVPVDLHPPMSKLLDEIDKSLRAVLKGQLTVAAILGVLYMVGLSVIGLKYSLGVGAIAGICRLVPYLDVIVGGVLTFVVIISDPSTATWSVPFGAAIVFVVVQAVDGMFITPRVIGERVGLHPAIVILSIIAFSDWLGFVGVLFAIPILATAKILFAAAIKSYRMSSFYRGKAA